MLNLTHFEIIGHVGKTELKTNGTRRALISIATNEQWTKDGQKQKRTDWHHLTTFAPHLVDLVEKHVAKGDYLRVTGTIRPRSWEQDGETKYTVDLLINEIGFLAPRAATEEVAA